MANSKIHFLHGKFQNIVKLTNELDKISRKFGTDVVLSSTEIHLVEMIGDNSGISVTDLAKLCGVTKGAVSQNLKRLDNKGFISKGVDPGNISRSMIFLTEKGYVAFESHREWHRTNDGGFLKYFKAMDDKQIEFILEALSVVEEFLTQSILAEK